MEQSRVRAHMHGSKMVKEYFRKPSGRSEGYLKTHALWEKEKDPKKRKEFEQILHVITQKASNEQLDLMKCAMKPKKKKVK